MTHQACALAKCGRERVEDIHGRDKPLFQSLIAAPRLIQFINFPFKYGEDSFRRETVFYLDSEWVGSQVFARLLPILFQGIFEDWFEI